MTENNKTTDAKLRNVIEKDNVLETKVSSQGTSNEDGTVIDTETEETNPPKSPLNTSVESNYVSETNENVTSRDAQFDEVVSQNLPKTLMYYQQRKLKQQLPMHNSRHMQRR